MIGDTAAIGARPNSRAQLAANLRATMAPDRQAQMLEEFQIVASIPSVQIARNTRLAVIVYSSTTTGNRRNTLTTAPTIPSTTVSSP